MTESIIFSIVEIRPNISFVTLIKSKFAINPSHLHIKVMKTFFCYLKDLKNQGIMYSNQDKLIIEEYYDLD